MRPESDAAVDVCPSDPASAGTWQSLRDGYGTLSRLVSVAAHRSRASRRPFLTRLSSELDYDSKGTSPPLRTATLHRRCAG
jgi:hypothetical protein